MNTTATDTRSPAERDGYYVEGEYREPIVVDGIKIEFMRQVFASEAACDEYHRCERQIDLAEQLIATGHGVTELLATRQRLVAARERAAQLDWTPAMAFAG